VLDGRNALDEDSKDPQQETADERHCERARQKQPRRDGAIEPPSDEASHACVLSNRVAGGSRDLFCRSVGQCGRARIRTGCGKRQQSGSEGCNQVSNERRGNDDVSAW
jgi:hypothetical protein